MSAKDVDFESSFKSGITPDLKRIKRYDQNRAEEHARFMKMREIALIGIPIAAVCYFINRIFGIVVGVIALLIIAAVLRYTHRSKRTITEAYTEGCISPGLIIDTDPLTIMVLATITANENVPDRYACFKLRVKELPDTPIRLHEKVPCSCMYGYRGGDYHYAVQPFPVCWATADRGRIEELIEKIDEWNRENTDEYEVIKRMAEKFPDLKNKYMLLLDENYEAVAQKYYLDSEYQPLDYQLNTDFPKTYPEIKYVEDGIAAAGFYNQMIDLAVKDCVYEYISTPGQKDGDPYATDNTGLLTYMGDPAALLEAVASRGVPLAQDEYPVFGGLALITTKGFWLKDRFTPWTADTDLEIKFYEDSCICIALNGKRTVMMKMQREFFDHGGSYGDKEWKLALEAEKQNFNVFLKELKRLFINRSNGSR